MSSNTVPAVLAELLANEDRSLHSNLPAFEGAILQHWVSSARPEAVLEIGLGFAISTLHILSAPGLPADASYVALDPFQDTDWHGAGRANLHRAGASDRVEIVTERSELALPRLLADGRSFDFAFVDGFHTFDQMLVEFYFLDRLMPPGSRIVFDDAQLPSVQKMAAYIGTYPNYEPLPIPEFITNDRVARVRSMMGTPSARVIGFEKAGVFQRPWSWFVDF